MSKYESDEFKKLKAKWYSKLKKTGFEDAEDEQGRLKQWSSSFYTQTGKREARVPELLEARQDYYRLASHLLHDHKFTNRQEKRIWELHSKGVSYKDIADKVQSNIIKVQKIVQKLARIMKEMYLEHKGHG